eukprot:5426241-Prymnesium_polylepis.1
MPRPSMPRLEEQPSDDASVAIRGIPAMRQQLVSARANSHHQSYERRVEDQPGSQCQQWPRSLPKLSVEAEDVHARSERKPRRQCPHGYM